MRIVSINIGASRVTPAAEPPFDREWESGIFKYPVGGAHWLRVPKSSSEPALKGDSQVNTRSHGGPDKAINVFPIEHYERWRRELKLSELGFGAFGENFTSEGMTEDAVAVGDTFEIGEALVQISQPRAPCWKLAFKWKVEDLVDRIENAGTTGWYLRVLREGNVKAGDSIELVERNHPEWTIAKLYAISREKNIDRAVALELSRLSQLSEAWRTKFSEFAK